MSTQSEAILESNLIQQLVGLGYAPVRIQDEAAMLVNLQHQLEAFNGVKFSEREFESILNHLGKGNVFERPAHTSSLRKGCCMRCPFENGITGITNGITNGADSATLRIIAFNIRNIELFG